MRAHRVDAHGGVATAREAEIVLDTALDGRPNALDPDELFRAAIALA
jgi:hypothetical protein